MSEKDIENEVTEILMPKYRRSLIRIIKHFVSTMHNLGDNCHFRELMQTIDYYMQWKRYEFEKALKLTMRKKRHLIEELLDSDSEDETDDADDETSETDASDTEASASDEDEEAEEEVED